MVAKIKNESCPVLEQNLKSLQQKSLDIRDTVQLVEILGILKFLSESMRQNLIDLENFAT